METVETLETSICPHCPHRPHCPPPKAASESRLKQGRFRARLEGVFQHKEFWQWL